MKSPDEGCPCIRKIEAQLTEKTDKDQRMEDDLK